MIRTLAYQNRKTKALAKATGVKCASFDLLAGKTCPFADICRAYVSYDHPGKPYLVRTGEVLCFAAKIEMIYPNSLKLHALNTVLSRSKFFAETIIHEIEYFDYKIIRMHSSGDFYSLEYWAKWRVIASNLPNVYFFGYSKNAYVVRDSIENPLPNVSLVYSHGGVLDDKAESWYLPTAYIVTPEMESSFPYPLACVNSPADDYDYIRRGESFGLKLH